MASEHKKTEVAAALYGACYLRFAGLKLSKAHSYLPSVQDRKQVIPFRRSNGGVGRVSQAKQFKASPAWMTQPGISTSIAPQLFALFPFAAGQGKEANPEGPNRQAKQVRLIFRFPVILDSE